VASTGTTKVPTEARLRAAMKKHEAGMKAYRKARAEGVAKGKRPHAEDNTAWNSAYRQLRKRSSKQATTK
jgi:hypothetical protein